MKRNLTQLLTAAIAAQAANIALAQIAVPATINYQGTLVDAGGIKLPDGNTNVIFRIYDSPLNGVVIWGPKTNAVAIVAGVFNTQVGGLDSVSPAPREFWGVLGAQALKPNSPAYLELSVGSAVIQPRQQILSAPFAFVANTANTAGTATNAIKASSLVDGSGTPLKVARLDAAQSFTSATTFNPSVKVTGPDFPQLTAAASVDAPYGAFLSLDATAIQGGKNHLIFSTGGQAGEGQGKLIFQNHSDAVNLMVIDKDGNVGIGNTAPTSKLDVSGAITGSDSLTLGGANPEIDLNGSSTSLRFQANTDGVYIQSRAKGPAGLSAALHFGDVAGISKWMTISSSGKVGIGNPNPRCPLDVLGSISLNYFNTQAYGMNPVGVGNGANAQQPFSILAAEGIGAHYFYATSDRRIKDVRGISDRQHDVEVIQKLRVTDYQMVDKVAEGTAVKKGFIAQEVQAVIPEAVTTTKDFIPSVYALATEAKFDPQNKSLRLMVTKPHALKAGDRVRLFADDARLELTVAAVTSDREFVVDNCEHAPKQVFVYGKYVEDFLNVDYNRIFTTGISAIQQLLAAEKEKDAKIADLEQRVGQMAELREEFEAFRKQVASQLKALNAAGSPIQASLREGARVARPDDSSSGIAAAVDRH